jgi:hypothetical protein
MAELQRLQKKKKNLYVFSSQLRADQKPGSPWEGQLMCTLFSSMRAMIRATPMMQKTGDMVAVQTAQL